MIGHLMYVLHYAPDNASLILRLALEEARLPYRCELVDRRTRAQDSPAYRALNPTGLIPTLITPDGPISETGAALLYLSEQSDAGLAPPPGAPARTAFLRWLFFLSNTLHADMRQLFYPEYYVPPGAEAEHHQIISARLTGHFRLIDTVAANDPALFGPPSALALYTLALIRWPALYPKGGTGWFTLTDFPALHRLALIAEARPAIHAAQQAEGLGPTPFSAPQYASPPEGSAT